MYFENPNSTQSGFYYPSCIHNSNLTKQHTIKLVILNNKNMESSYHYFPFYEITHSNIKVEIFIIQQSMSYNFPNNNHEKSKEQLMLSSI